MLVICNTVHFLVFIFIFGFPHPALDPTTRFLVLFIALLLEMKYIFEVDNSFLKVTIQ